VLYAGLLALILPPAPPTARRWLLAFTPWLVLALHQTPWGGGTADHRYLTPALPLLAPALAVSAGGGAGVHGAWGVRRNDATEEPAPH